MTPASRLPQIGDRLPPFSFGVAGIDYWDELTSAPGRIGIVRDVRSDEHGGTVSGVNYEFEAVEVDVGCRWRRTTTPGRWETDLGMSRAPQALPSYTSLQGLVRAIQERYQRSGRLGDKKDDDLLLTLDRVLDAVVTDVASLHGAGQLAGLLTPKNIVSFFDEQHDLRVILPDAGYRWRGAPPGPHWLKSLDEDWGELWAPRASDIFQGREPSPEARRNDLLLLARLCVWVLEGRLENPEHVVRSRFVTGAEKRAEVAPAPCWQTLYRTLAPESELKTIPLKPITSVAEFAAQLKIAPLSDHFRAWRSNAHRETPWKAVVIGALVAGLIGGAGYLAINPKSLSKLIAIFVPPAQSPNPLCPHCRYPSALLPILDKLSPKIRDIERDLETVTAGRSESYDERFRTAVRSLRDVDELLDKLRKAKQNSPGDRQSEDKCVRTLEERQGRMINRLGEVFVQSAGEGNIYNQTDLGRELVALFDEWQGKSATGTKEKPSWHEIICVYLLGQS